MIGSWKRIFISDANKEAHKKYTALFTRRIHSELKYSTTNFTYDSASNICFPDNDSHSRDIVLLIGKGDSEAIATLKHLRNAIAHGRISLTYIKGMPYINAKDYSKDNNQERQTAYYHIPLEWLKVYHNIYQSVAA